MVTRLIRISAAIGALALAVMVSQALLPARSSTSQVASPTPAARYVLQPSPSYEARTAADVLGNLPKDPFGRNAIDAFTAYAARVGADDPAPATLGQPVYVRAAATGAHDEWLVPVMRRGNAVGLITVDVFPDGTAQTGGYGPWTGAFPHPLSAEAAKLAASIADDPAQTVELVWAPTLSGEKTPLYRVVRGSGAIFFVLPNGGVQPVTEMRFP
jgi:hypothetical protein